MRSLLCTWVRLNQLLLLIADFCQLVSIPYVFHGRFGLFSPQPKTSTTLYNFLYAMAVHPDIQRKVQVELDSVIGQGRLPHAGDRPTLPYADAAWKESQRWITSVPMTVPHLNGEEDVYKGMRIPKGSKILLNIE
jgi:cytochrome P450